MSTPSTSIYICSGVPLNNRYDHTLYFASKSDQETYFASKVTRTFNDYTYVRRSWKLKVAATMEAARVWSYLYFRNGTTAKYYYYFINQIEYLNENTVELSLELDVLQTYLFEWKLNPCYVEREHSATDAPGENTVDEGLNVGEYVIQQKETVDLQKHGVLIAAGSNLPKLYLTDVDDPYIATRFENMFTGFGLFAVDINNDIQGFADTIYKLNSLGKLDTIFTMWMYPLSLVSTSNGVYENVPTKYIEGVKSINYTAGKAPINIDGYTPKNKKLLQYPYCFLYASNNAGGAAIYQYHHFNNGLPKFEVTGNISPDAVVKLTPVNYKQKPGILPDGAIDLTTYYNHDEALSMSNYPVCAWNNDTYKMWLAQNQNQQNLGLAMSGLKILGGAAAIVGGAAATGGTGGLAGAVGVAGVSSGVGMIASGASEIGSQLAQRADMEVQPPQSRGAFTGSHNISNGLQNFELYHKTIDAYHAEMIDNYFTMYGYACRKVKRPNINSRPAFNYVKTIGSNITGDFAMEDVKLINNIFDKGVTFWKDAANVGNYDLDNAPKEV